MSYWAFLISHPLFWAFVSGGGLGCSLASATRRPSRQRRPNAARSRKWTAAALWAALAVAAATCGVFLPEGLSFLALPSLYVAAGSLVFFALALRFPRAGGIPALVILAAVAVGGALVMDPFIPVRGEGSAATVTLISAAETAYVEVESALRLREDANPVVIEVDSPRVIARCLSLQISDYLFFLGAEAGVVLESLSTANDTASLTPGEGGRESALLSWIVERVPLLSLQRVESQPVTLNLLRPYQVVGLPDGRVTLRTAGTAVR